MKTSLYSPVTPLALHEVADINETFGYLIRRQITEDRGHLGNELRVGSRGICRGHYCAVEGPPLLVYIVLVSTAPGGHVDAVIGKIVETADLGNTARQSSVPPINDLTDTPDGLHDCVARMSENDVDRKGSRRAVGAVAPENW